MSNGVFDAVEEAMSIARERSLLFCVCRRKIEKEMQQFMEYCVLFNCQSFAYVIFVTVLVQILVRVGICC